jgi:hypothetical protein
VPKIFRRHCDDRSRCLDIRDWKDESWKDTATGLPKSEHHLLVSCPCFLPLTSVGKLLGKGTRYGLAECKIVVIIVTAASSRRAFYSLRAVQKRVLALYLIWQGTRGGVKKQPQNLAAQYFGTMDAAAAARLLAPPLCSLGIVQLRVDL